ncbi:MAG TPA: APC family permease [Terriglobales bacterium]|nr:APC family permease [Terriglobales bacterium]
MAHPHAEATSQLRREMGFWDVLLFNIAAVLGPRWIAAAAHNGTSSVSLWAIAAILFFLPTALVITELSTRYPTEGGLYIWTREAFGDFHGFVAGWCYWVYSFFYFPGLLVASASMGAYIGGAGHAYLANDRMFLLGGSLALLAVAVVLNIVGLNIGKWLQNAGGVGTYVPLLILIGVALAVYVKTGGSHVHLTWHNILPNWNFDTVNFWSQIAFAFTGMELVCAMSEEVHDPQRTFPRAILGSGVLIAVIYILGTIACMVLLNAGNVDPKSGVFQAITSGSTLLKVGFFGVIAAILVTVGNAGGVGTTVAGVARVPFAVGIDSYLPAAFGKIHPRWRTPYISILIQAIISAVVLILSQINETMSGAYQVLVDAAIILYFLPFLYMYAAAIKLSYRRDRRQKPGAVLIPGGRAGVWLVGALGFSICLLAMALSMIPPGETTSKSIFEMKLIGGTGIAILIGLALYWHSKAKSKRVARA